jgi:CheY-like chemotaxis protein
MQDVQAQSPLRVLLVDDYPDTTSTMAVLLELWGHDVRVASDGPQALAIARDYRPDVIFLDTAMPGMDGNEVARRLRHEVGLSSALLVSLSGYGTEADRDRARQAGCDEHLLKPVDPEVVQRLLDARQQRAGRSYREAGDCSRWRELQP